MTSRYTIPQAKAEFDRIMLPYAPQQAAVEALDEVRLSYLGRRPGAPCGGAMLIAPIGCGKTCSIENLTAQIKASGECEADAHPILHVEIPTEGTVESIPTAILRALRAPRPDLGRTELRWLKAIDRMKGAQVQLIAFDEFNRANRRETMRRPIATAIRERIMDAGIAPVAIVGSEEASLVLQSCPELAQRLDDRITMEPLAWYNEADQPIIVDLLANLDEQLVSRDLVRFSNLADEAVAEPLVEASSGAIRAIMKIVRIALGLAMEREATAIDVIDLEEAVIRFAIGGGFIKRNPFTRQP